jgi:hypothetical protein
LRIHASPDEYASREKNRQANQEKNSFTHVWEFKWDVAVIKMHVSSDGVGPIFGTHRMQKFHFFSLLLLPSIEPIHPIHNGLTTPYAACNSYTDFSSNLRFVEKLTLRETKRFFTSCRATLIGKPHHHPFNPFCTKKTWTLSLFGMDYSLDGRCGGASDDAAPLSFIFRDRKNYFATPVKSLNTTT